MEQSSFLVTLVPILSTLTLLSQMKEFSWLTAASYMLPLLIPLFAHLPFKHIQLTNPCRRASKTLSFTSRLKLRNWDESPDSIVRSFSTVLWDWNRKNKTVNCKQLMQEGTSRWYDDMLKDNAPFFIDDATNRFWHSDRPTIHYTMWVERITDRDGNVFAEVFLRIELTETSATPNQMMEHIESITAEAIRIKKAQHRVQRVLVSTEAESDEKESIGPAFMAYEFNTMSSFDNFFCEEADLVRADLRQFLENKETYTRTGRPWTYTVLNEGPPGVGKTKLVKAIAALTGYTLIVINLSHIKTTQMLYQAFHMTTLAGETVPHEKRLYYIPEVDTQMCEFLKTRTVETQPLQPIVIEQKDGKRPTVAAANPVEDKKPTLGAILNVLDGVPERYGHILVLDTNHLEDLDAAFIRPGRVDRILSWKKLSSVSVRRFLENYYGTKIPVTAKFPDRSLTAAELQSKLATASGWTSFVKRK